MNSLAALLKDQADACKQSAGKNGANPAVADAFHVCFIVLSSLADKIAPNGGAPVAGPCGIPESAMLKDEPTSPQVGGTHYKEGQAVSPWSLQKEMASSGNAFVDSRRADAIKYTFRMKGDKRDGNALPKLLEDMKKAKHCLEAGIEELQRHINSLPKA